MSAVQRCIQNRIKLTKKDKEFRETVSPFKYDYSLSERCISITSSKKLNPFQFFFYLALVFTNDKWKDTDYDFTRDTFTNNLHVIPPALELIIQLNLLFFPQCDDKKIEESLVIAREKLKNESQKQYQSFIALIDHFQPVSKTMHLNFDERTFPSYLIRSCYNDL